MDFGKALRVLKKGGMVTREGWNAPHRLLVFTPNQFSGTPQFKGPVIIINVMKPCPDDWQPDGIMPWTASQADIMADDWVEVR